MADPETEKDTDLADVAGEAPAADAPAEQAGEQPTRADASAANDPSAFVTDPSPADTAAELAEADEAEADQAVSEDEPDAALVELQSAEPRGPADTSGVEPRATDDEPAVPGTDATGDVTVDEGGPGDAGIDPLEDGALMKSSAELKAIVEALIFASPEPLTPKALLKLLDSEPKEDVLAALEALKLDYERPGGLQLVEVAGGFQIVTRPDLHEWVRRLFHERSTQKLSVQALETLAVIAYRQPITALEITEVRGVSASGVLNTLLERHLIKIVGRKQVVGRPFMYATTKEFLIRFGLKDLSDLPRVEDMAESLGIESSLLVEQSPTEEQLPLSEPDLDRGSAVLEEGYPEESDEASPPSGSPSSGDDDGEEPGPSVH